MALSMYDVSVPVFERGLRALSAILDKAVAHCEARKIDPQAFLGARLFPDMRPFTFQVMQTIGHSSGAVERLRGGQPVRPAGMETFPALQKGVQTAIIELKAVKPADLEGEEKRIVTMEIPGGALKFTGADYLLGFALPNFFFHYTTAYDILRQGGLEIGKRDFIGQIALQS
jgi:hypothetical protein